MDGSSSSRCHDSLRRSASARSQRDQNMDTLECMRLLAPVVLTSLVVPGCLDKPVQPGEPSTSETTATTMIPVTESMLETSMTPGTETATDPTTGTTSGTATDTSGVEPWDPVECVGETCRDGEVCLEPGEFCESYEPDETEVCPLYGCYDLTYPPPVCAAVPVECQDAPDFIECILDVLCDGDGCFSGNSFDAGVVSCGAKSCHCP